MNNKMAAMALGFLMSVAGGTALADSGSEGSSGSAAAPSPKSSGQQGSPDTTPGPVGFAAEEVQTAPWTVEHIDKQKRSLALEAPDGTRNTVTIPSGTPGFDSLKKGDQIQLDYVDAAVVGMGANRVDEPSQTGSTSGGKAGPSTSSGKTVRRIRKVDHNGNTSSSGTTSKSSD